MITLVSVYEKADAAKILYELLRERSTEDDKFVNISHRKLPDWEDHLLFMASNPYRAWYLVKVEKKFVGTVYLSRQNEIGIVLLKAHRGKGYGPEAVKALIEKHEPLPEIPGKRSGRFLANINPNNGRSIQMFLGLGFEHLHNVYTL